MNTWKKQEKNKNKKMYYLTLFLIPKNKTIFVLNDLSLKA
jgi:hypothetical protein